MWKLGAGLKQGGLGGRLTALILRGIVYCEAESASRTGGLGGWQKALMLRVFVDLEVGVGLEQGGWEAHSSDPQNICVFRGWEWVSHRGLVGRQKAMISTVPLHFESGSGSSPGTLLEHERFAAKFHSKSWGPPCKHIESLEAFALVSRQSTNDLSQNPTHNLGVQFPNMLRTNIDSFVLI